MTMSSNTSHPALFNLGFRPFFAGASLLAVLSVAAWLLMMANIGGLISSNWWLSPADFTQLSPYQWHAHEMIYGYSMAVIAGFLLTAVKNWTGIQTLHGYPLGMLFGSWVLARLLWLFGEQWLTVAAFFDLLFNLSMMIAVAMPIIKTRQWRQMAILSKLVMLAIGNILFYLELFSGLSMGMHIALYGGLYLIIGLILTIGRRIIPMFIQNGVSYPVSLFNAKWVDLTSLAGLLGFFISEVFLSIPLLSSLFATIMLIITSIRLVGWYTHGIWKNPLLWCFHITLFFIAAGFLLFLMSQWFGLSPFLSVHAFSFGAIGIMTMGMMARVSTGHTGRSFKTLPRSLLYALLILSLGAVTRVIMPVFFSVYYPHLVIISGILWLIAFSLFFLTFLPYWLKPRVDQKYG